MSRRIELQGILEGILGSRNVYFEPPSNVRMNYPAIVYTRKSIDNLSADDGVYKQDTAYEVIVIDQNPDSHIVYDISRLPKCRHTSHFVSENLNHDGFTLYY